MRFKQMSLVDYEHELNKAPSGPLTNFIAWFKHSTKYLKNTNWVYQMSTYLQSWNTVSWKASQVNDENKRRARYREWSYKCVRRRAESRFRSELSAESIKCFKLNVNLLKNHSICCTVLIWEETSWIHIHMPVWRLLLHALISRNNQAMITFVSWCCVKNIKTKVPYG